MPRVNSGSQIHIHHHENKRLICPRHYLGNLLKVPYQSKYIACVCAHKNLKMCKCLAHPS